MVAGIKSERWPTSNRNPRPDCLGIRNNLGTNLRKAPQFHGRICGPTFPDIIDIKWFSQFPWERHPFVGRPPRRRDLEQLWSFTVPPVLLLPLYSLSSFFLGLASGRI